MMPLDSWIDEDALAMMRALAPPTPAPPTAASPAGEASFFSTGEDDPAPVPSMATPPRIARADEAAPEAIERMRRRLAEIRQRAEIGGIVRAGPARIQPSLPVPVSPVEEPEPAPAPIAEPAPPPPAPKPILLPITSPIEERAPTAEFPSNGPSMAAPLEPVAPGRTEPVATEPETPPLSKTTPVVATAALPETSWVEPLSKAEIQVPAAVEAILTAPEAQPPAAGEPEPLVMGTFPKPLLPPLEVEDTWESECLPPLEPVAEAGQPAGQEPPPAAIPAPPTLPTAPLPIPEGPLSLRIAAFRHWLETDCGLTRSLVIDQRGNTLHPSEGHEAMVAAAAAIGTAWAEACAVANPEAQPRAAHSAWGGETLAVVPVPTRFGSLHVAGIAQSAISPEMASAIADALRRAAGV